MTRRKRTAEAELIAADLAWLAGNPRGRRILWRLWQSTGVFGPAVTDPAMLAFAEGRRSVGLEYWQYVERVCSSAAALAVSENLTGAGIDDRNGTDITSDDGERTELAERWADIASTGGDPGSTPRR